MAGSMIEADYVIVGAGATGMAFADSLLTSSGASMVIVDRRDRPGGHWNDAYPFVRLHQPAQTYGVNSRPLGSDSKDQGGLNQGLYDLASGNEVLSHYDLVMKERLLPSGRVTYFPMSEWDGDGTVSSRLSGERTAVGPRKVVDSTYSQISVPSTHTPSFSVASDLDFVPVNDLPREAPGREGFVVIGAGKTGMDACVWLLENGADPDGICWVMPRDSWLLNRLNYQPGKEFLERRAKSLADQVTALVEADSVDDVFVRLEEAEEFRRIDPTVRPTAYHCATISDGELEQLRRIKNVVRLGRVTEITSDKITLEHGTVGTNPNWLHVDCSAVGIPRRESVPVFQENRITLQFVRLCQPAFSAALIAHVEATVDDEAEKNRICRPIPGPNVPLDWLRMMVVELENRRCWSKLPELADWIADSRLDGVTRLIRSLDGTEAATIAHLQRYREFVRPAVEKLPILLAGA